MSLSPRARLLADIVLITGMVALSFLPAVGTQQKHFAIAAGTIRIFAAVYAAIVILAWRVMSPTGRRTLDFTAAATLALMAWLETFPAGNHLAEIGIYSGVAAIVFTLAVLAVSGQRLAVSV